MLKVLAGFALFIVISLIIARLQRRFSPETLANGFMDYEKGKEIAPTIFKKGKKPTDVDSKKK